VGMGEQAQAHDLRLIDYGHKWKDDIGADA
jgi:hypothetical protein